MPSATSACSASSRDRSSSASASRSTGTYSPTTAAVLRGSLTMCVAITFSGAMPDSIPVMPDPMSPPCAAYRS